MTKYEQLEEEAVEKGLQVLDLPLQHTDGMCYGDLIGIRSGQTEVEKTCVLAEEIAHADLTVGDILDQTDVSNRKQERKARIAAYERLIGLSGLVRAFDHGCRSRYEAARFLDVTEEFLDDTVNYYHERYGVYVQVGQHLVIFEPGLTIMKFM